MRRNGIYLALAAVAMPAAAGAQPPPDPQPTVLTIRPAAEPVPALKYRLVPERRRTEPGNAALFYHRAIQLVIERRVQAATATADPAARTPSIDEKIASWVSGPISDIPHDEAKGVVQAFGTVLREVELGAARRDCDWGLFDRTEGINLMLPEVQETRSLARLVALKARLAILDGDINEAMHWIQVGLVLGRHVANGPTIIQALVGVAIDSMMLRCLEDAIQAPGTPSLYWALADRPRPFLDLRPGLEGERYMLEKELPELDELDSGVWSVDRARAFVGEMQAKMAAIAGGTAGIPEAAGRLGLAALAAKIYPEAKQALIAGGRPADQVEAMPIVQVASLYSLLEYQRLRDNQYKWMNVPYWQAYEGLPKTELQGVSMNEKLQNPLLTMFRLLTPALNAVRLAGVRLERQFDALQVVEAIRLYAATHDGKLPPSLDALDVPAPIDPATGKPFEYKADGNSATLSAPIPPGGPDHPSYAIRYVLRLAE